MSLDEHAPCVTHDVDVPVSWPGPVSQRRRRIFLSGLVGIWLIGGAFALTGNAKLTALGVGLWLPGAGFLTTHHWFMVLPALVVALWAAPRVISKRRPCHLACDVDPGRSRRRGDGAQPTPDARRTDDRTSPHLAGLPRADPAASLAVFDLGPTTTHSAVNLRTGSGAHAGAHGTCSSNR